jgi:hypothetical protein
MNVCFFSCSDFRATDDVGAIVGTSKAMNETSIDLARTGCAKHRVNVRFFSRVNFRATDNVGAAVATSEAMNEIIFVHLFLKIHE